MGAISFLIAGVIAILTVILAVAGSTVANNISPLNERQLWVVGIIFGALAILFIALSLIQARRGSSQPRPRRIRKIEEVVDEGFREEPPTPQTTAPIAKPPEPYFVPRYPLQENFTGRVNERALLTQWLLEDDRPVLALTAIGGMGKSALTWAWLQRNVLGLPLPGLSDEPAEAASTVWTNAVRRSVLLRDTGPVGTRQSRPYA